MPLKDRSWYPWVASALWGLVVLALVLVNSGNVVLAVAVGVAVALLSLRIETASRRRE